VLSLSVPDRVRLPVDVALVKVSPEIVAVVEKRLVAVNPVDDAVASDVWPVTKKLPDTDRLVVEALARVDCPVAVRALVKIFVADTPVVEALVILASVEKRLVAVNPVDDAVASDVWPVAVRALVKIFVADTPVVEAFTAKRLENRSDDEPRP